MSDFDVIVVGSGAGGGMAAWSFANGGKRVLVLERGLDYPPGWTGRDLLRNHRYSAYGHNTGPDPEENPRVVENADGLERTVLAYEGAYQNNAMAVGGGTRVYGAQAWRFHPWDFEMASRYGVPEGSSLADWPIGYEDLAPFYATVERELGVCGGDPAKNLPARESYPMLALSISARGVKLKHAAERKQWANQSPPLLINSHARGGRGGCIRCRFCVGFGCPTDAKAGTQNTVIPELLRMPGCELWSQTRVTKLLTDPQGRVTGVELIRGDQVKHVSAEVVVVAAGAIETARLLMLSATAKEPEGLGNSGGHLGRHLQGHCYPGAQALFSERITDTAGPGPSIATTQFNHNNPGIVGGGMLADDFLVLPPAFARDRRAPGIPAHGLRLKDWVRSSYRRSCHIFGPVQDIPSPTSRVRLHGSVVDHLGLPVARISGTTHAETVRTCRFMQDRAVEWLTEAGAVQIWSQPVRLTLSAGQHQAGTCRMATSVSEGVVDPQGRVFGHENLLVCDGSVHVTNGGFNPVLTIMATALRSARLFRF